MKKTILFVSLFLVFAALLITACPVKDNIREAQPAKTARMSEPAEKPEPGEKAEPVPAEKSEKPEPAPEEKTEPEKASVPEEKPEPVEEPALEKPVSEEKTEPVEEPVPVEKPEPEEEPVESENKAPETPLEGAEKISLGSISKTYEPVSFFHRKHQEDFKVSCKTCHHECKKDDCSDAKSCSSCHKMGDTEKYGKKIIKLKNAFHKQCMGCHKKTNKAVGSKKAPTGCKACHALAVGKRE